MRGDTIKMENSNETYLDALPFGAGRVVSSAYILHFGRRFAIDFSLTQFNFIIYLLIETPQIYGNHNYNKKINI